jgi:hypothetical protein
MMDTEQVLVFDGYDASGKTTLARLMAERTGGRYIKVFAGDLGALIGWLYETRQFAAADVVARVALDWAYAQNRDASWLIFDRHWLTMFALLPETFYANWGVLPTTFLCWADATATEQRLVARGERLRAPDDYDVFVPRYRALALRFGALLIDTSQHTPEQSLAYILCTLNLVS